MKQPQTVLPYNAETEQTESSGLDQLKVSDVIDKSQSINAPSGIRIAVMTLILAASSVPGCAGRIGFGPKESKDISALLDRKEKEAEHKEWIAGIEKKLRLAREGLDKHLYLTILKVEELLNSKNLYEAKLKSLLNILSLIEKAIIESGSSKAVKDNFLAKTRALILKANKAMEAVKRP